MYDLEDAFSTTLETLNSYFDPHDPAPLDTFVKSIRSVLFSRKSDALLTPDYIAIALYRLVRFESPFLIQELIDNRDTVEWEELKTHIRVHTKAHDFINSFEGNTESLALAVLCLYMVDRGGLGVVPEGSQQENEYSETEDDESY